MATTGTVKYTVEVVGNQEIYVTGYTTGTMTKTGSFPSGKYKITGASINLTYSQTGWYNIIVKNNSGNTLGTVDAQSSGEKTLSSKTVSHYTNISTITLSGDGGMAGVLKSGSYVTITVSWQTTDEATSIGSASVSGGSTSSLGTLSLSATASETGYTHKYRLVLGSNNTGWQDATTSEKAVSASYAIPLSWAEQITGTSGNATVYLRTYNSSGSLLDTDSKVISISIPDSYKPAVSATATAGNQITIGSTEYTLQNLSKATLKITATHAYYSKITKITISGTYSRTYTVGNPSASVEISLDIDPLTQSGTNTFTITATDQRGRTASTSITLAVTAYSVPTLTNTTVQRCDSEGNPAASGTAILVGCTTAGTSLSGNSFTLKIEGKLSSAASWAQLDSRSVSAASTANLITYTQISGTAFDAGKAYDIRLTLTDTAGGSATATRQITAGFVLMRWEPENKAFGFGTYPQGSNRLEIASDWDVVRGAVSAFSKLASLDSTVSGHTTTLSGHTTSINSIKTAINGLKPVQLFNGTCAVSGSMTVTNHDKYWLYLIITDVGSGILVNRSVTSQDRMIGLVFGWATQLRLWNISLLSDSKDGVYTYSYGQGMQVNSTPNLTVPSTANATIQAIWGLVKKEISV